MNIAFIDLKKQQERIYDKILDNIKSVLDHGQYIMGPEVRNLEEKLSSYVGARYAIGCSSGTDALLMALMAYDVGPGDAIFTTPFTFVATAEVISLLGATPVFVDIDPETYNIDPELLKEAVAALREKDPQRYPLPQNYQNLKPRGIIAVDLFGQCADYNRINTIAKDFDLFVLEDAAQSFGAEYHGERACSLADISATSFFPAKPLGSYGDGGMVFTDDEEVHDKLASIRVHGKGSNKYDNIRIGINGRLDTLQAAILLAKFEILPEEIELRQQVANRYKEFIGQHEVVKCPFIMQGLKSAWAQYSVVSIKRAEIQNALKTAGIPSAIYYPMPLHLQSGYRYLGYCVNDFPVSENVADVIFSLPMHPYLAFEDQAKIAGVIIDHEDAA